MSVFKRGINNVDFIKALNSNIHFQKMILDENLFIAIRNEKLNVYYFGQSICQIEYVKNEVKFTSHNKYIGLPIEKNKSCYSLTGEYLNKIEELKRNTIPFQKKEKVQVKRQIIEDPKKCVIDIEVTFGKEDEEPPRSIDYVSVEKGYNSNIKLVFHEAKLFNNPEIRSESPNPKIFAQLDKYEKVLKDVNHQSEIIDSYKTIFQNIIDLNLMNKGILLKLIENLDRKIEIDSKPKLIVFEIDKKDEHLAKLKRKYADRLIEKFKIK